MRFSEELWKSNKLIELVSIHARIGWQGLRRSEFLDNGEIYLITGTDFINGSINFRDCKYIDILRYEQDKNIQVSINDLLITKDGSIGKIAYVDYLDKKATLNAGVYRVRVENNEILPRYLFHYLNGNRLLDFANKQMTGGTIKHLNQSSIINMPISYPSLKTQSNIIEFLNLIENRIQTQNKIIEDFELLKKEISNQIFNKLHKFPTGVVEEYINYEQPQKYIVNTTEYVEKNTTTVPVLTANQAFVLGYTNETEGIYNKGSCIIIDDFTLDCKYVDFDFKVKSSAIKILKANDTILIKYFYEYLKFLNLSTEEHKRHYISEISRLNINVPSLLEQSIIVNNLNLFTQKIENEKAILNLYKEQKNYLLCNMFI